jgi:hypothetical protein
MAVLKQSQRPRRRHVANPTPSKTETAAAPIPEQMTHPEANPYYDAFEAQIEAAKRALLVCRFVTEGELAAPVQCGSGHFVISQEDIQVLKSAFLVAAHIAYGIRRRLERGALVEDGRFCLGRDRFYQHAYDFFRSDPALWGGLLGKCRWRRNPRPRTRPGSGIRPREC